VRLLKPQNCSESDSSVLGRLNSSSALFDHFIFNIFLTIFVHFYKLGSQQLVCLSFFWSLVGSYENLLQIFWITEGANFGAITKNFDFSLIRVHSNSKQPWDVE